MSSGRRVGAFFDIDGTVLPGPSIEMRFAWWLLTQRHLGWQQIAAWLADATVQAMVRHDRRAFHANRKYLAGLSESVVSLWNQSLASRGLTLFAEAAERIEWHASRGHYICFVSGTLEPLARVVARRFGGCTHICATKLDLVDRNWTGFVHGTHVIGREKARVVAEIARREGLSLEASFAYGNHSDDIPMLQSVGNPVVVNPGFRFRTFATQRHWKIERWRSPLTTGTTSVVATGRTALSSKEVH